ncbi:MAG: nicotinamide mononucleotide transporter, partial [Propionibacteriaceae bacterium]|nr:nicotinamide mononucleotide transporter [Propionibacteriaceae bacterium]
MAPLPCGTQAFLSTEDVKADPTTLVRGSTLSGVLEWLIANWTEVLGFTTGAVCVVLAVLRNVWTYPIGLANNAVFIGLFAVNGLYATAGLQIVFAGLAIHGWLRWTRGVEQDSEYIGSTPA